MYEVIAELLNRGNWAELQQVLYVMTLLCLQHMQTTAIDNTNNNDYNNDNNYNSYTNDNSDDYDNFVRLFFYVNSLILLTISWRKCEREDVEHLIVYYLRKFNKTQKKAKKKKKKRRRKL